MTETEFDQLVEARISQVRELLLVKGKEYRRDGNVFHNFEAAGKMSGQTPQRALHGFLLKHLVSYNDMLNDIDTGKSLSLAKVDEKLGDIIVYFFIQEALLKEHIYNEVKSDD